MRLWGWNAARWRRNANSSLQDFKTLLERTRNAARRRRNANSCSQDFEALLEEVTSTQQHVLYVMTFVYFIVKLMLEEMISTQQHLAHLLKYYPRPPCTPSLNKSRFFRILQFIYLLTSLHFWNSLYVYTRGILGCLLGFWPPGQNPAGAINWQSSFTRIPSSEKSRNFTRVKLRQETWVW